MKSLLLKTDSPVHRAVGDWVKHVEAVHQIRIMFASVSGSRPMGMATPLSDNDLMAVHIEPDIPRLNLALDDGQGQQFDLLSWHIDAVSGLRPHVAGYPSYDMRTDEQREARKHLGPTPESHVTELLLYQHVWDDRGHLQRQWPTFQQTHLNTLNVLDLLYAKGRGLLDNFLQGPQIPMHRCLSAIHRVLGIRWILERNSLPPIDCQALLLTVDDPFVKRASVGLLQVYRSCGVEKYKALTSPDPVILSYLERQLDESASAIRTLSQANCMRSLDVE